MPAKDTQLHPDESIGDGYVIERHLGAGGMGEVYLAHDARLERRVAIKLLLPGTAADEANEARFVREAKTLSRVNHPNVVAIHAFGRHHGSWYIVMEYVDGEAMDLWLKRRQPVVLSEAIAIVHQIASGIAEAHAVGIVHRDIKPANVLLRKLASGAALAKVLDFGLARGVEVAGDGGISGPGDLLGTPAYMAPERIQGLELDGRSDLYSLAVVAFQMLTGKLPFSRPTMQGTMVAHLVEPLPPAVIPGVDAVTAAALQVELHRAMAKNPMERHDSILAFADALAAAVGSRLGGDSGAETSCPCCGHNNLTPGGFCSHCGSPVPLRICPTCRARRQGERHGCAECGAPLVGTTGRGALLARSSSARRRGILASTGLGPSLVTVTATMLVGRITTRASQDSALGDLTALLMTSVEREGGRVLALLGGELVAIFGLGGMREWETEAAVDAALTIRSSLARAGDASQGGLEVSFGVALGQIGTFGAGVGWGTALAGGQAIDAARTAASVAAGLGNGGVCLDEQAWREVKGAYFAERAEDQHRLILRRKPVAFLDCGPGESNSVMIGREVELAQLGRACRRVVRQHRAAIAPVSGATGVGKSRLIGEFTSQLATANGKHWHVDIARCTHVGIPVPYEPFVHLLRARVLNDDGLQSSEALRRAIRGLPGMDTAGPAHVVERRIAALARLLGGPEGKLAAREARPASEAERLAAFEAVGAYVRGAAAAGPVLLVIEDLDLARSETMALLVHLIQHCADSPVLFVLSMTEARTEELLSQLQLSVTQAALIEVPRLEPEECGELMADLLGGLAPPAALVETVHRFSEGLPMRVEEAVDALIGDGIFARVGDEWRLGSVQEADRSLDRSMAELVKGRVGRLSAGEQQVLLALAVAAHQAPVALLAAMLDRPVTEGQILALRRSGFASLVPRGGFGGESQLALRNAQAGPILVGAVPAETAALWHRRAAGWMTAWTGARPADFGALIAGHFVSAGDNRQAMGSLLEAAQKALFAFSNRDAFDILLAAAEVGRPWIVANPYAAEARLVLAEVLVSLAEVGHRVAELPAATAAADEALSAIADDPAGLHLRGRAICARGDLLEIQGQYAAAIAEFASAAALLEPAAEAAPQIAHARSRQAMVLVKAGDLDGAADVANAALIRWAGGSEPALLRAYGRLEQVLGHVDSQRGAFEAAAARYEAAIVWVERAGDLLGVAMATVSMGNLAFRARDLPRAESLYRDAVRQFRSLDLVTGRVMAQTNLGNLLVESGRHVEALRQLQEAEQSLRRAGSLDMLPEVLRLIAACNLALGEVARAAEVASEAVERAQSLDNIAVLEAARITLQKVHRVSRAIQRISTSQLGAPLALLEQGEVQTQAEGESAPEPESN